MKRQQTVTTYACDGCGVEQTGASAPAGWATVAVTVSLVAVKQHGSGNSRSVDLCRKCLLAVRIPGIDTGA